MTQKKQHKHVTETQYICTGTRTIVLQNTKRCQKNSKYSIYPLAQPFDYYFCNNYEEFSNKREREKCD